MVRNTQEIDLKECFTDIKKNPPFKIVSGFFASGNFTSKDSIAAKFQQLSDGNNVKYPRNYAIILSNEANNLSKKILVFEIDNEENSSLIRTFPLLEKTFEICKKNFIVF